jgi:hypothetical protein
MHHIADDDYLKNAVGWNAAGITGEQQSVADETVIRGKNCSQQPRTSVWHGRAAATAAALAPAGRSMSAGTCMAPLTFQQWKMQQLLLLDLQFLVFYAITHLLYGVKTAKVLCSRGLARYPGSTWEAAALCGSSSHWKLAALLPPGLASLARQVVSLTQASSSSGLMFTSCDAGISHHRNST